MIPALWEFALGDPAEGIDTPLGSLPGVREPAALPHRTLDPDTPYWYVAHVDLPPCALELDADDGAQLFADGERVLADGYRFALPGGARRLVIRVLNKAMYGGLRSVKVVPLEATPAAPWPESPLRHRLVGGERLGAPDEPCSFAVFADVQDGVARLRQHIENLSRLPLDFAVGNGDLVVDAHRPESWTGLFDALGEWGARTPLALIGGNHDYDGCFDDFRSPLTTRFGAVSPWFAWSAGNARFVALDPNVHYPTGVPDGSAQRDWLLRELRSDAWRAATWRFVFVHQPPYSQGWSEYEGDLPIRELLEPLIEPHGIDFVLSGHTHDYERLTRTFGAQTAHFLILGGGGAGLERGPLDERVRMDRVERVHHVGVFHIDGRRVVFEAQGLDGAPLDRLTAEK